MASLEVSPINSCRVLPPTFVGSTFSDLDVAPTVVGFTFSNLDVAH